MYINWRWWERHILEKGVNFKRRFFNLKKYLHTLESTVKGDALHKLLIFFVLLQALCWGCLREQTLSHREKSTVERNEKRLRRQSTGKSIFLGF